MGAKFSVLPQRNETAAQMSERDTLAVYSERLVLIGFQLVVRRHGGGGAPSARARGSAPVRIPAKRASLPPSPVPFWGLLVIFSNFYEVLSHLLSLASKSFSAGGAARRGAALCYLVSVAPLPGRCAPFWVLHHCQEVVSNNCTPA